jgi:hypothetical protein
MSVAPAAVLLAGRYRLDRPVASGRFGEVWRGTDTFLARPVAVKLLHAELAADAGALARFRDSARRTGSVVHEGIARIYDYIEPGSGHPPLLVMEFVDGPSLTEIVADGPVEPWRVMDVVAQAADALHAANQAGLAHGDIRAANVLLSRDGVVKLTDFGIAAGPWPAAATGAGARAGDLDYRAPERVAGARGTAAGDLFALGVLAYQCLTGGLPPGGVPVEAALAGGGGPARAWPAGGPAEAAALIGQLTATDPADRPSDAGQVARRAGELRDRMIGADTGQPDSAPTVPSVPQPSQQAYEAPAVPGRWDNQERRGRWDNQKRRGRRILLAAAAIGAAVIAFWLTSGTGAQDGSHPAAAPATPLTVEVHSAALRGQPVKAVRRQLRHLGLRVRIRWRPSSGLPPGMAISVRPTGRVATGTTIVVVGALHPTPTGPSQSTPASSGQPQPASKARHGHAHRSGRPHTPAAPTPTSSATTGSPTPTDNPTPTGSPTPTDNPTPTGSPTATPTATTTVSPA